MLSLASTNNEQSGGKPPHSQAAFGRSERPRS